MILLRIFIPFVLIGLLIGESSVANATVSIKPIKNVVIPLTYAHKTSHSETGLKFFWWDGTNMHVYYPFAASLPNQYMRPIISASNNAIDIAAKDVIGKNYSQEKMLEFVYQLGLNSIGVFEKNLPYTFYTSYSPHGISLSKLMTFALNFDLNEANGFYESKGWKSLGLQNYSSSSPLAISVGNVSVIYLQNKKIIKVYNDQGGKLIYSSHAKSISQAIKEVSKNKSFVSLASQ